MKVAAANSEQPALTEDAAQLSYANVTLMTLLMRAYGLKYRQISVPAWLAGDHYDVKAKLPESTTKDQIPRMLQSLLAERFGLKIHRESRAESGYALTIAKGGPRMNPHPRTTPPGV